MGFASYFEDIQEAKDALRTQLRASTMGLDADARLNARTLEQARALVRAAERLVTTIETRIDDFLELATDPSVEVIGTITALRRQQRELEAEVMQRTESVSKLQTRERELQEKVRSLEKAAHDARKQARRRERDFERLADLNPTAAYDLFSTPAHIAMHKPEA